jgi:surfactin synthase thioesterase subunit
MREYMLMALASIALAKRSSLFATSSLSFLEHSYFATINNDYLTDFRLQYYQLEKFFVQACPAPTISESLFLATPDVLEEAYSV